jgi:hypothetical protein
VRIIRISPHQGQRLKVRCHKCGDVIDSFRGSIWCDLDSAGRPESAEYFWYHELCKPELGDIVPVEREP